MKLTRNESADRVQKVGAMAVENAPESTQRIRDLGVSSYIEEIIDPIGMQTDHYEWLFDALSDGETLDLVDALAARARIAGGEIAVPWRD